MDIKRLWKELDDRGKANFVTICIAPILLLLSIFFPKFFWDHLGGTLLLIGGIAALGWLLTVFRR